MSCLQGPRGLQLPYYSLTGPGSPCTFKTVPNQGGILEIIQYCVACAAAQGGVSHLSNATPVSLGSGSLYARATACCQKLQALFFS